MQDGGDDKEVQETVSTELCQRRPQAQTQTIIYLGRDQKLGVERRYRAGWPNWCVSYLGDRAGMSWNQCFQVSADSPRGTICTKPFACPYQLVFRCEHCLVFAQYPDRNMAVIAFPPSAGRHAA